MGVYDYPERYRERFRGSFYGVDENILNGIKSKDETLDILWDNYEKMFCLFRFDPETREIFEICYYPANIIGYWIVDIIREFNITLKEFIQKRKRQRYERKLRTEINKHEEIRHLVHGDRKIWNKIYEEYFRSHNPHKPENLKKDWYRMGRAFSSSIPGEMKDKADVVRLKF